MLQICRHQMSGLAAAVCVILVGSISGQNIASRMRHTAVTRTEQRERLCDGLLGPVPPLHFVLLIGDKTASGRQERLACAIEAAWRFTNNTPIAIWTDMPVHRLSNVTNNRVVHICAIDFDAVFEGTPLHAWHNNHSIIDGPFILNNLSNALRLAILYKIGGTYIDVDVVILRSGFLNQRTNIAVGWYDSYLQYNNAYLQFNRGHPLLSALMDDFTNNNNGFVWGNQGPMLLTRVIEPCIRDARLMCADLLISGEKELYAPVQWDKIVVTLNNTLHDFHLADWFTTGVMAVHWFNSIWEKKVTNETHLFCIAHNSIMHEIISHSCPIGERLYNFC
jgi:hypothetical protein